MHVDPAEIREAQWALRYAMRDLTPRQLRYIEAFYTLSTQDVAEEMGVSIPAVHAGAKLAFEKMKRRLAELGIERVSDILTEREMLTIYAPKSMRLST